MLWHLRRIVVLLLVAGFFAVVLSPAVDAVGQRLRLRRALSVAVVFLVGMLVAAAVASLFVVPAVKGVRGLVRDAPAIARNAESGHGPVAGLARRLNVGTSVNDSAPRASKALQAAGTHALTILRTIFGGIAGVVLVAVLTFMLLLEGPGFVDRLMARLDPERADRLRGVGSDVRASLTGCVAGNLITSFVAGTVMAVTLLLLGVPYPLVFSVWVAVVDLLPQVGGLLAALPTVVFAALHSPTAGIVVLVVFLVYQQVENHLLQPAVMSQTVNLSPLVVLLSVLAGAELGGMLGALFAIPVAGTIQVIVHHVVGDARPAAR
jgi:predicted PurR-regulated permease PerM